MAENQFEENVQSLLQGMEQFLTTKTVVGEPVRINEDTVVLPLVDMTFGVGAGAFAQTENNKNSGAGGLGGRVTPSAVLVFQNGTVRVMNLRMQDSVSKILDMAPDLVQRFTSTFKSGEEETFRDQAFPEEEEK